MKLAQIRKLEILAATHRATVQGERKCELLAQSDLCPVDDGFKCRLSGRRRAHQDGENCRTVRSRKVHLTSPFRRAV